METSRELILSPRGAMWLPEEIVEMPSTGTSVELAHRHPQKARDSQASEKWWWGCARPLSASSRTFQGTSAAAFSLTGRGAQSDSEAPGSRAPSAPGQPAVALNSELRSLPTISKEPRCLVRSAWLGSCQSHISGRSLVIPSPWHEGHGSTSVTTWTRYPLPMPS